MVDPAGYPVDLAARDLMAAGMLVGVWCCRQGGLVPVPAEALTPADGAWSGAGLDSRTLTEGQLFVALPGEHVDGRDFLDRAVATGHWVLAGRENGWSGEQALAGLPAAPGAGVLLCRDGAEGLAFLAGRHRSRWQGTLIGITGSNGKTTCKDLCAALLGGAARVWATAGNHNNRLGVPLTLLGLQAEHRFAVVEMGASSEGQIAFLADLVRPSIGVITNAAAAHLSEFGSLEGVVRGKGELLDALPENGTAVLNADSPGFDQWRRRAGCPVVSWGREAGDHRWTWKTVPGRGWVTVIDGESWPTPLPGRHNGANLTAALLAVRAAGLSDEAARSGLARFEGSPHRSHLLRWDGRLILDDSYNANPRSMLAAGSALVELASGGKSCAVLGAMAELGDDAAGLHRETGRSLADLGVQVVVAVGAGARPLGEGFDERGGEVHYCPDQEAAADWIRSRTRPRDVVLLKGSRSSAMEIVLDYLPGITTASQGS